MAGVGVGGQVTGTGVDGRLDGGCVVVDAVTGGSEVGDGSGDRVRVGEEGKFDYE